MFPLKTGKHSRAARLAISCARTGCVLPAIIHRSPQLFLPLRKTTNTCLPKLHNYLAFHPLPAEQEPFHPIPTQQNNNSHRRWTKNNAVCGEERKDGPPITLKEVAEQPGEDQQRKSESESEEAGEKGRESEKKAAKQRRRKSKRGRSLSHQQRLLSSDHLYDPNPPKSLSPEDR